MSNPPYNSSSPLSPLDPSALFKSDEKTFQPLEKVGNTHLMEDRTDEDIAEALADCLGSEVDHTRLKDLCPLTAEEIRSCLAVITKQGVKAEERKDVLSRKKDIQMDFETVRAAVARLPRKQQLALVAEFADQTQALEKPDISTIKPWRGKKIDGPALHYLKEHYSQYLTTFGALKNHLYRQDIENHDSKLVKGVEREAHALGKKPRAFLPTISDEMNDRAKDLGFDKKGRAVKEQAKEVIRTADVMRIRKHRQKRTASHS